MIVYRSLITHVTGEALAAWTMFAGANGVSLDGLIEALGQNLAEAIRVAEATGRPLTGIAPTIGGDWVEAARAVDFERREAEQ